MILYTYMLMVASFGSFTASGNAVGYPNTHLQFQASQYNVGIAEQERSNPTFTTIVDFNCDVMRNNQTDQDYIVLHAVEMYTGNVNGISPSEPYVFNEVVNNNYVLGNVPIALTDFSGFFECTNYYKVDNDHFRFKPSIYINEELQFSQTFNVYSDDYFYNDTVFHSPYYTFSYQQFFDEYQNRLTLDTTRNNFNEGYEAGYADGFSEGNVTGYANGYNQGFEDASDVDTTALTIFNGILNVGMLPVNVFLAMLNFNVLGINISSLVMSALTISMTIIVIRTFTGGNKEDK